MLKTLAMIVLVLSTQSVHASDHWLTAKDITYVFVGREIKGTYRNGVPFSETYRRVGRSEYREGETSVSGQWSTKGDQFCTLYDGNRGGCFQIKSSGTNCFEYWLITLAGTPDKNWIARGWQSKYPSTCPALPR